MYQGYNLVIDENKFDAYLDKGNISHANTKKKVKETLDAFKGRNGKLIASKIKANWFPPIRADVFISHSHDDADTAIGLAGWLEEKFGLTSFIDSCVWGYSGNLQRMIDNEYSLKTDKTSYDYRKIIRSAAHVNMMLSVALAEMINRCECIFFLNTPQSISSEDYVRGTVTESPWIYSEIAMTSLIQRKNPSAHRTTASVEDLKESVQMLHEVSLDHLVDLGSDTLDEWHRSCIIKDILGNLYITGEEALDKLYGMTIQLEPTS